MADELVLVELRRTIGPRRGPLYGPGRVRVPASFARSLGLQPIDEVPVDPAQEAETSEVEMQVVEGDLPDGFPARDLLIAGGVMTLDAVRAASDHQLRQIKGIGPAAVRNIRAALA